MSERQSAESDAPVRCECDARDEGAVIYHGGNADGCPRETADHMHGWPGGVIASPALCMACLFGCAP